MTDLPCAGGRPGSSHRDRTGHGDATMFERQRQNLIAIYIVAPKRSRRSDCRVSSDLTFSPRNRGDAETSELSGSIGPYRPAILPTRTFSL